MSKCTIMCVRSVYVRTYVFVGAKCICFPHVLPCQLARVCVPFYPPWRGGGGVHNTSGVGEVPHQHGLVKSLLDTDARSSMNLHMGQGKDRLVHPTPYTHIHVCQHVHSR